MKIRSNHSRLTAASVGHSSTRTVGFAARCAVAFTLLELLVVITIIGLLATIGLPAIRGMTKSNATLAASRQLLDDLNYARRLAIANHTTVYMVFIPTNINNASLYGTSLFPNPNDPSMLSIMSNLYQGQFTTYALLALRSVGDQPGVATPHYLTPWRTLPNGTFIATSKYTNYDFTVTSDYARAFPTSTKLSFPFPSTGTNSIPVTGWPAIGFSYLGQLTSTNFEGEAIPLSHGSIFYAPNGDGTYTADVVETPPGSSITTSNVIHVDWLTGKSRVERQEVQ